MIFTNDILKVHKKQALNIKEVDSYPLGLEVFMERIELKNLYKQIGSQKNFSSVSFPLDEHVHYKSIVEAELVARIKKICNTIHASEYQDFIIKDVKSLIKKEKSPYVDINYLIDKLYYRILIEKKHHKRKFYSFYRAVIMKLVLWKKDISRILSLKTAQKLIISLLSSVVRFKSCINVLIPSQLFLREYLDIVATPKDALSFAINNYFAKVNYLFNTKQNEKRLYQIIKIAHRV